MPLYDALNEQLHPLPPALAAAFISSLLLPRAYVPTYCFYYANEGRGRR